MTLRELIQAHNLQGTPQEIADALNAKTIPVPNSELYTSTGIIMELGPELAREAIAGFMVAADQDPLLKSQLDKLNSTGIDLSHPLTQQFIDELCRAGFIRQEIANAIKAIGIRYKSLAEVTFGDGTFITPEQVAAALESVSITRKRLYFSCNMTNGKFYGSLMVEFLSDSEVVERRTYSLSTSQATGNEVVDTAIAQIRTILEQLMSNPEV